MLTGGGGVPKPADGGREGAAWHQGLGRGAPTPGDREGAPSTWDLSEHLPTPGNQGLKREVSQNPGTGWDSSPWWLGSGTLTLKDLP